MRRFSSKSLILIGLAIMLSGTFALRFSQNFTQALLTFAILGLGNVVLQVIFNPLLTFIAPRKDAASFMILRQITEALTAIAMPFLFIWSSQRFGHWQTVVWLNIILACLAFLWLLFAPIPSLPQEKPITLPILQKIITLPGVALLLLGIVTIGGFNNSLMTIVPRLLVERTGIDFAIANTSNTVFFALRLLGEIVGAFLLLKVRPWRFFLLTTSAGALVMLIFLFAHQSWLIFLLVGLTGFLYSSLTSLIFAQILLRTPAHQDAASGLVITSWAGASLFSLITGFLTRASGNQTSGLVFFLACSLLVVYLGTRYRQLTPVT